MSCKHGYWEPCDDCEEEDAMWDRAFAAGYQRGREDAANAVGLLGSWLDETVDFGAAIAAARGDGEQS